ncbi:MAG: hypothetical protein ACE5IL_00685 [Myxococcota bacterium]
MTLVRLAVDFEHASRRWWDSGGRELWEGAAEGFDVSSVLLERSVAESWITAAARIPGWDEGPAHAPHPVVLKPVDEDEVL